VLGNDYESIFKHYGERRLSAKIWGFAKERVNHRIYVTDQNGIVLLDSHNLAVGQDYSRWNDVHRTLNGKYGARSSEETIGDETSTVMYVAAPIMEGERIIGVVSVAKPNRSVQPFIDRSQRRLMIFGAIVALIGLAMGAVFSYWLGRELRRLREFAIRVSQGKRAQLSPGVVQSSELRQLALALETMRKELDGKAYVEHYVQTFAHEFKSPLAGIRAATELLKGPLPEDKQQRFLQNIDHEGARLEQLIEKLLQLASLEQQQRPRAPSSFRLSSIVEAFIKNNEPRITLKNIRLLVNVDLNLKVFAEEFLIQQAFSNLLDNAIAFCPAHGTIKIESNRVDAGVVELSVFNEGPQIPEYALNRIDERFFSLPRPDTGKKSTGLGLSFVAEVAKLHEGEFNIQNVEGGVTAALLLPVRQF